MVRCPNGSHKNQLTGKCEKIGPKKSLGKSPSGRGANAKWLTKFYNDLVKTIRFYNKDDYYLQFKNGAVLNNSDVSKLIKNNESSLMRMARNAYKSLGQEKWYESDFPHQILSENNFFAKNDIKIIERLYPIV